ncbi:hypothetical protein NFI96_016754, partial [Prochilodus magdalenae]
AGSGREFLTAPALLGAPGWTASISKQRLQWGWRKQTWRDQAKLAGPQKVASARRRPIVVLPVMLTPPGRLMPASLLADCWLSQGLTMMRSFPSSETQVCNHISACLTDICSWRTAHHLKLNPSKTELLLIPSTTGPHPDLAISLGNSLITPTEDARSLGVILDGQLSFSARIANLTRSCRFLLYNIWWICPFLSQEATQVLVQSQVISGLDYCNSLLAGLPLRAIGPLQLVQNAAGPERSSSAHLQSSKAHSRHSAVAFS